MMTITSVPAAHAWQPGRRCTELPRVALVSPSVPRWMRLNSICAVATTMASPNEDALLLHPRGAQHLQGLTTSRGMDSSTYEATPVAAAGIGP